MIDQSEPLEHEEYRAYPPRDDTPPKMDGAHEFELAIYLTGGPVAEGPKSESHQAKQRSNERGYGSDGAPVPVATRIPPAAGNA